jgi:hypothetical protein
MGGQGGESNGLRRGRAVSNRGIQKSDPVFNSHLRFAKWVLAKVVKTHTKNCISLWAVSPAQLLFLFLCFCSFKKKEEGRKEKRRE